MSLLRVINKIFFIPKILKLFSKVLKESDSSHNFYVAKMSFLFVNFRLAFIDEGPGF